MRYRLDGRLDRRSYKAIKRSNARRGIALRRARGDRIGHILIRVPDEQERLPCRACNLLKFVDDFYKDKTRACGRRQVCKPCAIKQATAEKLRRRLAVAKPPEVQVFALWYESNL